jgi:hypothetical protein
LERFISTKPSEVDALIERGKTKKPTGGKRKSSDDSHPSDPVVDLRHRRMRKRNEGR